MEDWAEIRRLSRSEGMSGRAIAVRLGVARDTVAAALASDRPPRYSRRATGSAVDAFEPAIRRLLVDTPSMPASVVAERVGWSGGGTVLRQRVAQVKAQVAVPDPADRLVLAAGEMTQVDLWFPGRVIPDRAGRWVDLPVLSMVSCFSRFLTAMMIPSRRTGDLLAGMSTLLAQVGGVPRKLLWDNEAGIGRGGKLAAGVAEFAGALGCGIRQCRPFDPETKGRVERSNGFQRGSFLVGRTFTGVDDFNAQFALWLGRANQRTVRAIAGRPVDVLPADRAAMIGLPAAMPAGGTSGRWRLGRDYYLRLDRCDYSVDPTVIGRHVDAHIGLDRVTVTCDGTLVAEHRRSIAGGLVITDPAHVAAAAKLRQQHQQQHRHGRPGPAAGRRDPGAGAGPGRLRRGVRPDRTGRLMTTDVTAGIDAPAAAEAVSQVAFSARVMRTPVIGQVFTQLAVVAREQGWSHEEYLAAVLGRQVAAREANGAQARIKAARFPAVKTLEQFNFDYQPAAPRELFGHLATAAFVAKPDNIVLLGPPGVGKTHLAIALAVKACQAGHRVLYGSAMVWLARLGAAHNAGRLAAELRQLARYQLLVLDEVGYLPLNHQQSSLLFQLVCARYETGSLIVTSNLPFSKWGNTFGDDIVAAATIDRLVHHAEVISLSGNSYRTRTTRNTSQQ